jgi:hypothetical protein
MEGRSEGVICMHHKATVTIFLASSVVSLLSSVVGLQN